MITGRWMNSVTVTPAVIIPGPIYGIFFKAVNYWPVSSTVSTIFIITVH